MSHELPLPDALKHLLEKRKTADRCQKTPRTAESVDLAAAQPENERSGLDRRERKRRLED